MIALEYDTAEMAELLKTLQVFPGEMEKATARAINKGLTRTRTEMVRLVRADYAVKAGSVRKELNITKAHASRLEGRIRGEGSPGIPLKEFARTKKIDPLKLSSTTRTKGFVRTKAGYMTRGFMPKVGIPVLVRKDHGKLPASGVFLAKMKSGHIGAFKRTGVDGQISETFGPSPLKILASDRYDEYLDDFAADIIDAELIRQANLLLTKRGLR